MRTGERISIELRLVACASVGEYPKNAREKGSVMQNEMCFESEIALAWFVLFESDDDDDDDEARVIDRTKQSREREEQEEKKKGERARERNKEDISADYSSRSNHRTRILSRTQREERERKYLRNILIDSFSVSRTYSFLYQTAQDRPWSIVRAKYKSVSVEFRISVD